MPYIAPTQAFTAKRILTPEEAEQPGAIDHAKQSASSEAYGLAAESRDDKVLPQDHSLDETVSPADDGGTLITVTVTIPL